MLQPKDRLIIEELRKDSRRKLTQLSEQTRIPVSTLHDRLKKLRQNNQVRLVTLPDYKRLRMPLQSWVLLDAPDREAAREHLAHHPHVNTVLLVNNGADFAVQAVFSDFADYDAFLEELRGFGKVKAHPVIEVVCKETARVAT